MLDVFGVLDEKSLLRLIHYSYKDNKEIKVGEIDENNILNLLKNVINYYKRKNFGNESSFTLKDCIDYLVIDEIINMSKEVNSAEIKKMVNELSVLIKKDSGFFSKSINKYIKELMSYPFNILNVRKLTMSKIVAFKSGIEPETFKYLFENHPIQMLDNYIGFGDSIIKNEEWTEILFTNSNVEVLIEHRLRYLLEIIPKIKEKKLSNNIVSLLDVVIDKIKLRIEDGVYKLTPANALELNNDFIHVYNYVKKCDKENIELYKKYKSKIEEEINNFLIMFGKSYQEDSNIDETIRSTFNKIIDNFQLGESLVNSAIEITHSCNEDSNKMESILEGILSESAPLIDNTSSNIPTNDMFTLSRQRSLKTCTYIGSKLIYELIKDKKAKNNFNKAYISIFTYLGKIYSDNSIIKEWEILYRLIDNIVAKRGNNKLENIEVQGLCYGAAMYTCSFLEKILRTTERYSSNETVYSQATLSSYLKKTNKEIAEVISNELIEIIRFYLLTTDDENRIGYNYRNRLAHLDEINSIELNPNLVFEIFYLFLVIVNSLSLYIGDIENYC